MGRDVGSDCRARFLKGFLLGGGCTHFLLRVQPIGDVPRIDIHHRVGKLPLACNGKTTRVISVDMGKQNQIDLLGFIPGFPQAFKKLSTGRPKKLPRSRATRMSLDPVLIK